MLDGLQTLNWDLLQEIEAPAHHDLLLDRVMIFGAQDAIFLLPLLLLALWAGIALATTSARAGHVAVSGAVARFRARGLQLLLMTVPAVLLAVVFNVALGTLFFEPRPFVTHASVHPLVSHAADASFPSDHAAVASALATILVVYALFLWRLPTSEVVKQTVGAETRRVLLALATVLAMLGVMDMLYIGYARVYAGVHYPGDIVGGILCGLVASLIAVAVRRLIEPWLVSIIGVAERLHLA